MPKIVSARVIVTCPGRNFVTLKIECDDGTTGLVAEHRLEEDEAHDVTRALAYDLVKQAYRL